MRVRCNQCGGVGIITKTDHLSENVANLYCRCKSAECGHTWVSTLAYSHTLSPSSKQASAITMALIDAMPPEAINLIKEELKMFGE
ncbi:ogr/Delta-like zinc finger family protein [Aeromonas jandaei]|uniref:ogr/Delta-like zinc finger family protein n=1 Tax=Aeromonas jandaei TaxID=650 RepID=UPI001ADD835F|nr:ogr/Delta-like zinc finger family protein [Aeromonas jandaei]